MNANGLPHLNSRCASCGHRYAIHRSQDSRAYVCLQPSAMSPDDAAYDCPCTGFRPRSEWAGLLRAARRKR